MYNNNWLLFVENFTSIVGNAISNSKDEIVNDIPTVLSTLGSEKSEYSLKSFLFETQRNVVDEGMI